MDEKNRGPLTGKILERKYELGPLLGQGAFGSVYWARQVSLGNELAVKVLMEHHFSKRSFRERFKWEAQIMANLDHIHIVPLHDFGIDKDRAYLVMPYLSGGSLQERMKHQGVFPSAETLRSLQDICAGLGYAHRQGVGHLDLKPSNVLIHGGDGRLMLSDFGLAHKIREGENELEGGSSLSLGTPYYMAPEHMIGKPTLASDVYAVGVILFQMLTGRLPFEGPPERVIYKRQTEPAPLLRSVRPDLSEALERMAAKALAKEPKHRYQSATELLEAFTEALAQQTQPPPIWQPEKTYHAPAAPGIASTKLAAPRGSLLLTYRGHVATVVDVAWSQAEDRSPSGRIASAGGFADKTVHIWDAATGETLLTYHGHTGKLYAAVWSPDSKQVASVAAIPEKVVQVWDARTGERFYTYEGHAQEVRAVAWSPDGRYLASGGADMTIHVWEVTTAQERLTYRKHSRSVLAIAWAPNGKYLASVAGDPEKIIHIWDAATGETFLTYTGHTKSVLSIAWSPDSRSIASGGTDHTIQVWNARTGETLLTYTGHADVVRAVAWSPDGSRLASGGTDKTVQVWEAIRGASLGSYTGHTDSVVALAWSPDGQRLASASQDMTVQIWQAV